MKKGSQNTATLKIYGERNTGTNYLTRLIETNLSAELLPGTAPPALSHFRHLSSDEEKLIDGYFKWTYPFNLGWKHAAPRPLNVLSRYPGYRRLSGLIFLVRNPYSWLLSLHKNPYHQTGMASCTFEQFLRRNWLIHQRDEIGKPALNPIQLWNRKVGSYLEAGHASSLIIRFEDLVNEPELWTRRIADQFDSALSERWFTNIEASTKSSDQNHSEYRTYYRLERWKEKLGPISIELINQDLDKGLMDFLQYRLIG